MAIWETSGGMPTQGLMFKQMLEHLIQAQENAAMLSHLTGLEGGKKDKLISAGWMMIAELLRQIEIKITTLAQGRYQ